MHGFAMRAGEFHKATSEMKQFYHRKFESPDLHNDREVMAMYLARTGPVPAPALFSEAEVEEVIFGMKRGKSAGPDGVVYEHLQVLMNSELKPHFVEFFNRILVGELELPDPWFVSRVAFLAKVAKPSTQAHCAFARGLQGVHQAFPGPHESSLSSHGLRPDPRGARCAGSGRIPRRAARHETGQRKSSTTLRLQARYLEAFDTISHSAVAIYLARLGPCREAHLLLKLVLGASVRLSFCGIEWTQRLQRGIV